MKHLLTALAMALPLWCAAQTVWRCGPHGRVYADAPCSEGRRLDLTQARPNGDIQAAQQQAQHNIRQAEVLRRERLAQEAAVRGNGLASLGSRASDLKPPLVASKPHHKRHPPAPKAADTWRATVPASRQKTG